MAHGHGLWVNQAVAVIGPKQLVAPTIRHIRRVVDIDTLESDRLSISAPQVTHHRSSIYAEIKSGPANRNYCYSNSGCLEEVWFSRLYRHFLRDVIPITPIFIEKKSETRLRLCFIGTFSLEVATCAHQRPKIYESDEDEG